MSNFRYTTGNFNLNSVDRWTAFGGSPKGKGASIGVVFRDGHIVTLRRRCDRKRFVDQYDAFCASVQRSVDRTMRRSMVKMSVAPGVDLKEGTLVWQDPGVMARSILPKDPEPKVRYEPTSNYTPVDQPSVSFSPGTYQTEEGLIFQDSEGRVWRNGYLMTDWSNVATSGGSTE